MTSTHGWGRRSRSGAVPSAVAAFVVTGLVGCSAGPGAVRYVNRDPVWTVDDRTPVPKPDVRETHQTAADFHDFYRRPVLDRTAVPESPRATNINSLGEVPDSTWFTNRIGVRAMSPREIAQGPNEPSGPHKPWTIVEKKGEGAQPGFLIEDARGVRYLLKLDPKAYPEAETGAEVVVQRLLWAVGYNVPENDVVVFHRRDLELGPNATKQLDSGNEVPLSEADVTKTLADSARSADGEGWRAVASKLIEGAPLGGYPMTGVREDDPNDRVPHEHRRDVRAQHTLFAWLGHTDVKESNTLDVWIEKPPGSKRGYVRHYLLDFGKALGVMGRAGRPFDTWAHVFDYEDAGKMLATLGLWRRPWERDIEYPDLRGVGHYDAAHYRPGRVHVARYYTPYYRQDRFDAYWAAKILIRFRRAHLEAAVARGEYSDPRARRYLVDTLIVRQRKTARYWFRRVNPVDYFRVERATAGWRICADDLMVAHDLIDRARRTHYELAAYDYRGRPTGWTRTLRGSPGGLVCANELRPPSDHEGYTMVACRTIRGTRALPATVVHLAREPMTKRLRVIGIRRL